MALGQLSLDVLEDAARILSAMNLGGGSNAGDHPPTGAVGPRNLILAETGSFATAAALDEIPRVSRSVGVEGGCLISTQRDEVDLWWPFRCSRLAMRCFMDRGM